MWHEVNVEMRRTKLHVGKEGKGTSTRTLLDEPDDVHPELHVSGQWAGVFVHQERQQNPGIYAR